MKAFQCVELFAGDGNVGRSMRYGMVATAQLELNYSEQLRVHKHNAFDMTTPAGFALRSCTYNQLLKNKTYSFIVL